MYTLLVTHANELVATHKQAIMERSTLVDELQFLVPPEYDGLDMSTFNTAMLEYISPVTKKYRTEYLVLQPERYKEHLQYVLPVDTKLTAEAGEIEIQVTFTKVELDAHSGYPFERVRKTKPCTINVFPIANWSQYIADDALTALDQRILQLQATQQAMDATQSQILDWQDKIIDDTHVSDKTTYSSKKIESFIDPTELNEAVEDVIEDVESEPIPDDVIRSLFED